MTLRKSRIFKTALIAAGLFALMTSSFVQAGEALSTILKNKELRVAVPVDYPPYGYVGADMVPQGYDIDMAKLMADKLGVNLQLVPVTAPNRVAYILSLIHI